MKLSDLTSKQLRRVYDRLYPRGYGAWDWNTLYATFPARATLMREVAFTHDAKLAEERQT